MGEVLRTVRFYAAFDVSNGDEREKRIAWKDVNAALAAGSEQENQMPNGDGTFVVGKPLANNGIALLKVSQLDLPRLYNSVTGELRTLDEVMGDEPLDVAEVAYFRGFPNGVVGLLYNHRGPKARGLELYLNHILDWSMEFRPIPRTGVLEAIEQAGEVKVFRVRIPLAGAQALEDSPLSGMRDLANAMEANDIEVIIRAKGSARERLARHTADAARTLLGTGRRSALSKMSAELARDEDIKGDRALDLLEEHIVVERSVTADQGRTYIGPDAALDVIGQAYREIQSMLASGLDEM